MNVAIMGMFDREYGNWWEVRAFTVNCMRLTVESLYRGRLHVKVACLWSSLECPGSQAPLTRTRPPQVFAHTDNTQTHTYLSLGPLGPHSLGWDEPTKAPCGTAVLDFHLCYKPLRTDVAKSQGMPLLGPGARNIRYVCLYMHASLRECMCLFMCMIVMFRSGRILYVYVRMFIYIYRYSEGALSLDTSFSVFWKVSGPPRRKE